MKILAQDNEEIIIIFDVKNKTKKALMVLNGEDEELWLPLSQIEVIDIISDNEYEILMPLWLAEEKEII